MILVVIQCICVTTYLELGDRGVPSQSSVDIGGLVDALPAVAKIQMRPNNVYVDNKLHPLFGSITEDTAVP